MFVIKILHSIDKDILLFTWIFTLTYPIENGAKLKSNHLYADIYNTQNKLYR